MQGRDNRQLVLIYIFLAAGCTLIGTGLVITTLLICSNLGINIVHNFWILAIPVVGALILNVFFIEIVQKLRGK